MSTTDPCDDPRLTAYALGELDPGQRAEVDALVARAPALRAEVERIRSWTAALGAELGREAEAGAAPALTAAQRAAIIGAAAAQPDANRRWRWLVVTGATALAASLIAMVSMSVHEHAPAAAPVPTADTVAKLERPALRYARSADEPAPAVSAPEPAAAVVPPAPRPASAPPAVAAASPSAPASPAPASGFHEQDSTGSASRTQDPAAVAQGKEETVDALATTAPVAASDEQRRSGASSGSAAMFGARDEAKSRAFSGAGSAPLREAPASTAALAPARADAKPVHRHGIADAAPATTPPAVAAAQQPFVVGEPSAGRPLASSPGFVEADEPRTPPAAAAVERETYNQRADNPFLAVQRDPLSTFSLDVDTASFSNVRRFLEAGRLPPRDAVRIEELVNYFPYRYPAPADGMPFGISIEVVPCPWNPAHQLARIGLKGKEMAEAARPAGNLVFLIDVSGSMQPANRLPLIKTGLSMLAQQLGPADHVAIVTYANGSALALPPTSGADKRVILRAIEQLRAEGGTNGGAGIQLAYDTARAHFIPGGVNRVILCTDGDFNVGVTDRAELVRMIEGLARSGVFLSVLGVGQGDLQDATMEQLADRGNGHYAYLDTVAEAQKVLIEQLHGTLVTIAKDVKVQVEFNPARIAGYRLLGYEKRLLATRDFNDDRKDAGDIGAGHTVTALYELAPAGGTPAAGELRYQAAPVATASADAGLAHELMSVKLRYKDPGAETSRLIVGTITDAMVRSQPSPETTLAAAVAEFGLLLRGSAEPGMDWARMRERATSAARATGMDYAQEFVQLVDRAMAISGLDRRER